MQKPSAFLVALCAGLAVVAAHASESRCFGTVANGHLEGGVQLPPSGPNFETYSSVGWSAGRTYVHSRVAEIVVAAYGALAAHEANVHFVYGETGWESGGNFRPHRSHQNGLSVDFFVPVRDRAGTPTRLPIGFANKLGYGIEFDSGGRYEQYTIDYEAIGEHLYQLDAAARARGVGIAMVIFDSKYLPMLFATSRGDYLRRNIPFMKGKPWVRHDEHYHVDFSIRCAPNAG
ncbi:penicillin-insensitive murein endopeptidase [Chitinolyticbacter albus]|uniref:penicillin-insensitive murein endopeptidase n=1 Tax=Chitinolyticbacter albus TaxID=2961951 RepID=UPI00210D9F16|nr:penicillin-insensitive murein endopeptidase [Chitinolyticbacter albus]